jgi:hypothetical protein
MEQKIFHGQISPTDFARDLISHFNRGNFRVQQIGNGDQIAIQIATNDRSTSGGKTAMSINLQKVEDGVMVRIGEQAWLGVAASLGFTALSVFRNPLNLLHRIDDLAQDIESLQITAEAWQVMDATSRALGTGVELSARLKTMMCTFCNTANPVGQANCISCGAPLGDVQPDTCKNCGFVILKKENFCPNCGQPIQKV